MEPRDDWVPELETDGDAVLLSEADGDDVEDIVLVAAGDCVGESLGDTDALVD